ncbi:MAG TPA: glycerophosphodiester phosphodiesterase [Myxococcota bacterium]|nr:glycerophosphodiester phosphodiesterase [Myxococcota bacterium]
MRPERALVIAHRGASGQRPENTLPAYELAVRQRADMIEIDLHRTRDGEIVVTHDERLEGLGGRGEIADASLAEVRSLDAGGGERVPTLDEVLDAFGARIPFNLELKQSTRGPYAGLVAETLKRVESRGLQGATLFSSFYDPVLAELRAGSPGARIGVLVSSRAPEGWRQRARRFGAEAVHFSAMLATAETVAAAHAEGLAVHVYTVDEPDAMRRLLAIGVDGLFTNFPDRMRALVG